MGRILTQEGQRPTFQIRCDVAALARTHVSCFEATRPVPHLERERATYRCFTRGHSSRVSQCWRSHVCARTQVTCDYESR